MYPPNNLAKIFFQTQKTEMGVRLVDKTKKTTLHYINKAINCCDNWNSFLDVGANAGHYSLPLLSKFQTGTAVEIDQNQKLLTLAEKFKNLNVIIGKIDNIRPEERFDFILLADVFEHIPIEEIKKFCLKISDLQNLGGILYILTPNPIFCGPATKSDLFYKTNNNLHRGHYKHYTQNEIKNIFLPLGYELIFLVYEESRTRQLIKRLTFGFSRRDKQYSDYSRIYRLLNPFFLYPLKIIISLLSLISFQLEKFNSENKFKMMSQILVFKKLK